jgi:hypothetical protein
MSSSHPEAVQPPPQHRAENYRGRNLLFLLLAIGAPAGILYLRLVFGYVASESRVSSSQIEWLSWLSKIALVLFFGVQLICARYVQRLLKPRATVPGSALQYVGVLLLCTLLSIAGTVLLEVFGYTFFLGMRNARGA